MKKLIEISLAVVASIGGFLEVGTLATSVQAGAAFGFDLIWAILLGTICVIFLVEMAGRFAAVSHHTIPDAIRERFGFNFFLIPFSSNLIVNLLLLASEIGGVSLALQLVTGLSLQVWAVPVSVVVWLLLWKGTFSLIEHGVSFLGLVSLCIVVAAVSTGPDWTEVGAGVLPSLPAHDGAHYWFLAVGILGASISPYTVFFYSSGAIEDKWDKTYLVANRFIAVLGMSFGAIVGTAALIVAAMVFPPRGIMEIASYDQIGMLLSPVLGFAGFLLFAATLGICCLGAALELSLEQGYLVAQGFGWHWGEDLPPTDAPGFSLSYTVCILLAALPALTGIDPLALTIFTLALTALTLPLSVVPFLFLMNDENYVGKHRNGRIGNAAVVFIIALAFILAIVTLPLQIFGR
jgi:Mn2+/Fe2+ NRAMP family transporter